MSDLVGITMRVFNNESYYEIRDCISHDYIDFFNKYDIYPVLISNSLVDPVKYFSDLNCKALILTGGEDILIKHEDIINENIEFNNKRDETEYKLLDYCVKNNIPILGICRGMQLINLYFKGKISNLNEELKIIKHVNVKHNIRIIDEKFTANDFNELDVNSYHNKGVLRRDISNQLKCFAITEDEVVEGFYRDNEVIGIQWHPERGATLYDEFIVKKWLSWMEEKK